jgi:hypothetical protein
MEPYWTCDVQLDSFGPFFHPKNTPINPELAQLTQKAGNLVRFFVPIDYIY